MIKAPVTSLRGIHFHRITGDRGPPCRPLATVAGTIQGAPEVQNPRAADLVLELVLTPRPLTPTSRMARS